MRNHNRTLRKEDLFADHNGTTDVEEHIVADEGVISDVEHRPWVSNSAADLDAAAREDVLAEHNRSTLDA
jgi:hypothetical protein